ncbi:MAG: hypothetical protein Kow0092_26490 [Deferrisomatales bacterium]
MPPPWTGASASTPQSLDRAIARERARGGYGDMTPLAATLLRAAAADGEAPDPALTRWARLAAPGDPYVHRSLAAAAAARGGVGEVLRAAGAWARGAAADPWVQAAVLLRLAGAAWAGCLAAAAALVAAGAGLFGRALFHDYSDSFPQGLRRYTPTAFGVLVAVALAAGGVGPVALLWVVALMLLPYLPSRGRLVLGISLGAACLLPWALSGLSRVGGEAGERAWALYRVWRGDGGADLAGELGRLFPEEDSRSLYARARVARRGRRYGAAVQLLERGLARGGDPGRFRLELGNVAFLSGDLDRALAEYERAAAVRGGDPTPWLNRHIAHLARLELAESDRALERARSLDADAAERLEARGAGEGGRLLPVSDPVPGSWVRTELLAGPGRRAAWADGLTAGLFTPVAAVRPAYFGAAGLVAALAAGVWGRGRRSYRCPACGFVVCPRCSRRVKDTLLCAACWAAGRNKDADAAERGRQEEAARRWAAKADRWRRVGEALLPGWAAFLRDRPVQGALVGVLWAGALGWAATAALYPAPPTPWSTSWTPWAAVGLLGLCHAHGLRRAAGPAHRARR